MKIVLLLNFLVETFFGLVFLFAPSAIPLFVGVEPVTLYLVRMYGVAALIIALLSLQMWLNIHEQAFLVQGLLLLALFHTGITAAQFINDLPLSDQLPPGILHALFTVGCWFFYFRER